MNVDFIQTLQMLSRNNADEALEWKNKLKMMMDDELQSTLDIFIESRPDYRDALASQIGRLCNVLVQINEMPESTTAVDTAWSAVQDFESALVEVFELLNVIDTPAELKCIGIKVFDAQIEFYTRLISISETK